MNEIFITKDFAKSLLPKRKENSNKGSYGSILNISGSINYRGAASLSTKSALKTGAGYVSLASVEEVIKSVCNLCPEAVFIPLKEKFGTISKENIIPDEIIKKHTVISIGCGIGSLNKNQTEIEAFFKNFLAQSLKIPVIIDADGLNILSRTDNLTLNKNFILTPHPGEMARLLKVSVEEIQQDRINAAATAAKKFNAIIVLKGQNSIITDGEKVFINKTGNSALSKAGSGDVLTGIISGLCAQGAKPFDSAVLGAFLHGLCGDIASETLTQYGVNASDLIGFIPKAIKSLLNS